VCKGEGVAFMRHLLGAPQELPIQHPRVTADVTLKPGGVLLSGRGRALRLMTT